MISKQQVMSVEERYSGKDPTQNLPRVNPVLKSHHEILWFLPTAMGSLHIICEYCDEPLTCWGRIQSPKPIKTFFNVDKFRS